MQQHITDACRSIQSHLAPRTTQKTRLGLHIDRFVKKHFKQDGYIKRVWDAIQEFYNTMTLAESDMLLVSGLDAVAYLRLAWLNASIMACVAIATFPSLVPLDWRAHNKNKVLNTERLYKVSLKDFTIQSLTGNELYFHILAGYGITIIVMALVWWSGCSIKGV